jgi:hypothetical protein
MYLTFDGGTLTESYSPSGGKKVESPYKFRDDHTLEVSRYPEHLVIQRYTDDEIGFRPEGDDLRREIKLIYDCRFVRFRK